MRIILGITGASGSILAKKALNFLSEMDMEINIVITDNGRKVFNYELEEGFDDFISAISNNKAQIILHDNQNMFSSIASGSHAPNLMIILPCSMSTLGRIATGTGDNLLCRAADCCIKERGKLVISPRETPLSSIHLKNMLALSENGAMIVPPTPLFYANCKTYDEAIDMITGRILKSAGIENTLYTKWRGL